MTTPGNPPAVPPAPPRDAATVLLLRDGADAASGALEVYLVKRSRQVDFMAGAHVFPGGRLDEADSSASACALLTADLPTLRAALGEDVAAPYAAGLFVAAIRETFEEAGLLLGSLAPGWTLPEARKAVASGARFATLVGQLDAAALVPWVRWVTPVISPKRFDARFFLARAPRGQVPEVDGREAVEGLWITPGEALARWARGGMQLAPATAKSLDALSVFDTADAAMAAARGRVPPVAMPVVWNENGRAYISLPGDPRHPEKDAIGGRVLRVQLEGGRYRSVPAT